MIYLIENKITSEKYVGYTSLSLKERFTKHKYNAISGGETYLYRAMRKYGIENFTIICLQEDGNLNEDEPRWINHINPEYNMTKGGEGGDTSASPNFIKSMKEYHQNKPSYEYATYGFENKNHTQETKDKQSLARKSYWENISEEERNLRSSKISGSKNPMYGKTPKNSIQVTVDDIKYKSKTEASRTLGKCWSKIEREHIIS